MKKIFTTFFLIFAAFAVHATLLLEENFSYTVGDTLGVRANLHGRWTTTVSTAGGITIASDQLSYAGYGSSGKGKTVSLIKGDSKNTSADYANYPFTSNITTGSIYIAMLINVSEAIGSGDYFGTFDSGNLGTGRKGAVFVKASTAGKYRMGLSKTSGNTGAQWDSNDLSVGQTTLLILKYRLDGNTSNANDSSFLYINPTIGSEEGSPVLRAGDGSDGAIKSFSLKIVKYNPAIKIGGMRIATTWDEALAWADATAPTLSSTLPANNATEVALNTPHITLTFNEAVKVATGISSTLSNGGSSDVVTANNFIASGNSISIPVTENFLQASSTYTFTLPANAVSDIAGNAYASPITLSFTTKSASSLSSENAITAFRIPDQVGASAIRNDSVFISVPFGANLSKIRPDSIGLSANARLKSGTSQATDSVDFTQVKKYVVEAENGTTRDWFVKVTLLPNDKADITSFIFTDGIVAINNSDTTIRVRMNDLSDLPRKPKITISPNATISDTTQSYNFASVITYTVTAENGVNQKRWRVIVSDYGTATLPVSYKGSATKSWQNITANGWLADGLGDDGEDGTSGRYPARFNTTGDMLMLRFDKAAEKVTFKARSGSSGKPHRFLVEQSADGNTWTAIKEYVDEMYATSSNYNSYSLNLKFDTRYVRWTYSDKDAANGTNIYFDEVAVNVRPLKATFTPANGAQNVAANTEVKIVFELPIVSINGVAVATHLNNVKLTRVDNSQQVSTNNTLSADRKTLTLAHSGLSSAKEYTISVTGTVAGDGGVSGAFEAVTFKVAATADDVKKDITSFSIAGQTGAAVINAINKTITVPVNESCEVKTATKNVTHNGASCVLIWTKGGAQCPIYYRCTANDGSYADWKISFSFSNDGVIKSQDADILSFSIGNQNGIIDMANKTVAITMPYGTNTTALTPSITISAAASIAPSSGMAQDFTTPVTYVVTAEDTLFKCSWVVTVDVENNPQTLSSECNIRSFKVDGYNGVIKNDSIWIKNLPASTNLSSLAPTVLISDKATVSPASGVAQDFTSPVTYTVTAEDGVTQKVYVVIVSKRNDESTNVENELYKQLRLYPNPVKDMLSIDLPQAITKVELYSISGLLLKKEEGGKISVSSVPNGSCIVKIYTENGIVLTQKVTINK